MIKNRAVAIGIVCGVLVASLMGVTVIAQPTSARPALDVRGGGTSIVAGGTGAPTFAPVKKNKKLKKRKKKKSTIKDKEAKKKISLNNEKIEI